MDGSVRKHLFHAVTGSTERRNDVVHLAAVRRVFRVAQTDRTKRFLDLAGGKSVAVAQLLAQ
jgi:hypothetical protein